MVMEELFMSFDKLYKRVGENKQIILYYVLIYWNTGKANR